MKKNLWQESLFDYLINFGREKTIHPADMIYFLMAFCGNCIDPDADEEDVRVFTRVFYNVAMEIINHKKSVVYSD